MMLSFQSDPIEVAGLVLTREWTGTDSAVFSVIRHSQSLCPTRQVGSISFHYSETERVPVRINGILPEDLLNGPTAIVVAKALLKAAGLNEATHYYADFSAPKSQVGIRADIGKDGNVIAM